MNVTAPLKERASRRPDAPAVIVGEAVDGVPEGTVYTFDELDRVVDALARRALTWGLRRDEHVSLAMRAHLPLLVVKLGLARAGIVAAGGHASDTAALRIVLRSDGAAGDRTVVADAGWWSVPARAEAVPMHPGNDATLVLQPTSGTTGVPKAVAITHRLMNERVRLMAMLPRPSESRLLCTSGPSGGFGMIQALREMAAGGTVVVAPASDDLAALIDRHRVTTLASSPFAIGKLLAQVPAGAKPASLAQVRLSGARLTTSLLRTIGERLCEDVVGIYGSTEIGLVSAGSARDMPGIDGVTGFLLQDVEVEALAPSGRPLPRGLQGPLRMRSPAMGTHYVGDPEATARVFRDGWCYGGDVGTVTDAGALVIAGRDDDLINLGGSKFSPDLIEQVLTGVAGIVDAAAFGVPDDLGRQVLHAAIVASGEVDVAAVERAFRARRGVPAPSVLLRLREVPRNENGKIRRDALIRFARSMPGRATP